MIRRESIKLGLLKLILLFMVTLYFGLTTAAKEKKPKAKKQPHIIFVLADDLGFHDVGYKGSVMKTPTIDQLATQGVKLDYYYVQPICSPTRCSLLSGRYSIHNGQSAGLIMPTMPRALPKDGPTLADKIREAGYATHAIGKWHMGFYKEEFLPHHRGFDTFYGFLNGYQTYYEHTTGGYLDFRLNDEILRNVSGRYSTHLFTERAQELIANHDKSKPLFLYLSHQAPHDPMQVPRSYSKPFDTIIEDLKRKKYAGMMYALDEGIANVTKSLKDAGMWDDTILVFSTDNGGKIKHGGINYPLRGEKFTLWEGGIRGIGFVSGGKNIKLARGTTQTGLMHVSDWYPTLIKVAQGTLDKKYKIDGVDNWDMLSEGADSKRNIIVHNINPERAPKGDRLYPDYFDTRVRAAIRVGDYKLITGNPGISEIVPPPEMDNPPETTGRYTGRHNVRLFNIKEDPTESHDLSLEQPERVKKLLKVLGRQNETAVPPDLAASDPEGDPSKHGGVWGPWL